MGYAIEQLYGTKVLVQLYNGPAIDEGNFQYLSFAFIDLPTIGAWSYVIAKVLYGYGSFTGGFFYDADLTDKTVKRVSCSIPMLYSNNDDSNDRFLFTAGLA